MALQRVFSYQEIREQLQQQPVCLIYLGSDTCQVCHAVRPAIEHMVERLAGVSGFYGSVDEMNEAAGQLLIFAIPAVLVFHDGKEIFRSARFIDLEQLRSVLTEVKEQPE